MSAQGNERRGRTRLLAPEDMVVRAQPRKIAPLGALEPALEAFGPWQPLLPFQLFGGRLPALR